MSDAQGQSAVVAPAGLVAVAPSTTSTTSVVDATSTPASVAPSTTTRPSTTGVPTTVAATVAPTAAAAVTTLAPTTTVAPTTTIPPSPAIVAVGAPAAAFVAVGTNNGSDTAAVQQRLIDLGFWVNGVDGQYGLTTTQAVMAFQKYVGLEPSARVDQETAAALTDARFRAHGLADAGTLIEVDKDRQLLFFVQDGKTVWVFNTSTGNGQSYIEQDKNTPGEEIEGVSITPNGLHAVTRERAEGWWEGDLGRIYRPKYFVGGVAVHGSNSIPNYPASHGCVRVSVPAMDFIWDSNLMPLGLPVWVHGAN